MYNIKLFNKISQTGLASLDESKYNIAEEIDNPDAIIVRSAKLHDYEAPKTLKAIARAGAGVNNIPIDKCSEAGIVVFNTPGANANAVKELVLTSILMSSRNILAGVEWTKTLKGQEDVPSLVEKGKGQFAGTEIKGKTLGIVGLGAIGALVANSAENLGMKVYGYDPFISVEAAWNLSRGIIHAKELSEIYENCDYISLHVPANNETMGMINKDTISQMKDNVRIINFSRAELVNELDMLEAIKTGKVSEYVIDFPTESMIGVPGVIAIPHLGGSTEEAEENCAMMASSQLKDFLENGNIKNSVNFPNVEMGKSEYLRVCVVHKNIPNMLAGMSGVFSSENMNINDMLNKSRNDYAYSILDVDADDISEEILKKVEAIDGVISVRVIKY